MIGLASQSRPRQEVLELYVLLQSQGDQPDPLHGTPIHQFHQLHGLTNNGRVDRVSQTNLLPSNTLRKARNIVPNETHQP